MIRLTCFMIGCAAWAAAGVASTFGAAPETEGEAVVGALVNGPGDVTTPDDFPGGATPGDPCLPGMQSDAWMQSEAIPAGEPLWYDASPMYFGNPTLLYGRGAMSMPYGGGGPNAMSMGPGAMRMPYGQSALLGGPAARAATADSIAGFEMLGIAPIPSSSPVAPAGLMPIPLDPNDPVMRASSGRAGLGNGYALFGSQAVVRFTANVKLDLTYDTGAYEGTPGNPATIAFDGTPGRGIFDMALSNAQLKSDVQLPSETLWAQGYYDLQLDEDGVEVRQLYGRVENLLGGKQWSTFGDQWVLPQSIVTDAAPAGAIVRPEQIQLHYSWEFVSGWSIASAIERPTIDDFAVPVGATPLRRYPDLAGRIRYQPGTWQGAQLAALVRQMGFEDALSAEEFATGWGVSGTLNAYTWGANNVRLGCSGGEGLGSYLFGLSEASSAAFTDGADLTPLSNFGCFAGYQHYWTESLWSNFVYGFCESETIPGVADSPESSQNAWVNVLYDVLPGKIAMAVEYQYGLREVANGEEGDNHHIQFALQIGVGYKSDDAGGAVTAPEATAARAAGQPLMYGGGAAPQSSGFAPSAAPQRFRRL